MRLILLLPAMLLELLLLAFSWVLAAVFPNAALCVASWASKVFPDLDWYLGAAPMNDKVDEKCKQAVESKQS